MCCELLAPIVAAVLTLLAAQLAVILTGQIRRGDFRKFEDRSAAENARRFPIPDADPSPAEERRRALSPLVNAAHAAANATQTTYHNAVVRSAGCLVLAFLALVLGSLAHQEWWWSTVWPPEHFHALESVLTWVDAIAIISVLLLFWHGRSVNGRWIAARARTEMLRQFQFLNLLFPAAGAPAGDPTAQFAAEDDRVKREVQGGRVREIVARIERFWSERKGALESHALTDADVSPDALLVYLRRRALRQLGWFADSRARLEHIGERRKRLLLGFYCVAAALATVKLALFLGSGHAPPYLLAVLLILTGVSAAMTAYYINQNARSLIHRYHTQQRHIERWLQDLSSRWSFADLPTTTLDEAAKRDIRTKILAFEELMVEELIDWTRITSYDAIELGP